MNKRCIALSLLAGLVVLASVSLTGTAFAQDTNSGPKPMFAHPAPTRGTGANPPVSLQTYQHTYNFVGDGGNQNITMVGTDAASTNTTTTIPTFIIPIRVAFNLGNGKKKVFDPAHKLSNGNTVIQNTINSPIFQSGIDFKQGGTDLGNTQYEDAYTRGNFWTDVMTNTNYHLLLGAPTVLPTQVLHVSTSEGTVGRNPFGTGQVGVVNFNFFFGQLITFMNSLTQIQPNTYPIFILYDTFLSGNSTFSGCCIGGYHDVNGAQTYSMFVYIDQPGSFSQDVSALSHEASEWIVDPLITNTACGGLMEVGDPLENNANFGAFPYTLNGFTYNLQDEVFLKYFGQSPATSVNSWETFQGTTLSTCQNGQ